MALGTPTMATPMMGAGSANATTASFTPTLGALLVAFAGCRASVLPGAMTLNPSALSWTALTDALLDLGSGARIRAAAWAAIADTAVAMTIQASSSSAGKVSIAVVQLTGAAGIPSNFYPSISGSGTPGFLLPVAPLAASTVLGYVAEGGAGAIPMPTGFTDLGQLVTSTDLITCAAYDPLSASASTVSWPNSGNTRCAGVHVEIQEATTGASRVPSRPGSRFRHMLIR